MPATSSAPAVSRAERGKLDKYERIKRAARELFRRKGFHQTTTSEIAELADVAKGTVFFHAGTKEALLVRFFQEDVGRSIDHAFATVPRGALLEQAMHVFNTMLDYLKRDRELARVFTKEVAFLTDDRHSIDAVMAGYSSRMAELIERAKHSGEIRSDADAALLAHNLFALYFCFQLLWLRSDEPSPHNAHPSLREVLELHLRGLRNAASPARRVRVRTNTAQRARRK